MGIEIVPPERRVVGEEGRGEGGYRESGGIVRHYQQVAIVGVGVSVQQPRGCPLGDDGLEVEVDGGGHLGGKRLDDSQPWVRATRDGALGGEGGVAIQGVRKGELGEEQGGEDGGGGARDASEGEEKTGKVGWEASDLRGSG